MNSYSQSDLCGTDFVHNQLLKSDVSYKDKNENIEAKINKYIESKNLAKQTNATYTIPIVVHVIHLGEPEGNGTNISATTILEAIDAMNSRFANENGMGIDTDFQFCLADIDPNGNLTNGITRSNGSVLLNYATNGLSFSGSCIGANYNTVMNLSLWPADQYYNIYVVKSLNCGAYYGLAFFPPSDIYNGTFIVYNQMNTASTVLTHESGHVFSLHHTFQGQSSDNCPENTSCDTQGDKVCDTQPHLSSNCSTPNLCDSTGNWQNTIRNYMSYCSTLDRFTLGQKNRMIAAAIVSPRASLLVSNKCSFLNVVNNDLDSSIVYPDPADDYFIIQLNRNTAQVKIEIYDITSKIVYKTSTESLNLQIGTDNLSSGLYFIKLISGDKTSLKKLIIY